MRIGSSTKRARQLRQSANSPEQVAWNALRGLRQLGFPVRRQHPIDKYIVDFAIVSRKLIIEVDGGIHDLPEVAQRDAVRQDVLEGLGWRVVRIPTETALSPDHLLSLVQNELGV